MTPLILNTIKIIAPTAIAFFVGIFITPLVSDFLYRNKMWKKEAGKVDPNGNETPIFNKLHEDKEVGTPKMGGIIVWGSALLTILILLIVAEFFSNEVTEKLSFLSREQTWLPLFTLLVGSVVGLFDDWFEVSGKVDYLAGGMSLKKRLAIVSIMSLVGAWWFYYKLGMSSILVPFVGSIGIGIFFIPFFVLVMLAVYSGGVIDGIDGLAGGVFAAIFSAYGVIAFAQAQVDLAAFCFVIVGGLLAFLWFNIPPARFYMAETGTMGLTTTLAVVAFLTGQVLLLPIIAFPLLATTASDIIQLTSKSIRNKKVFKVAPIHHHFEAIGWPSHKVTMRYWVISVVFAILGMIIALIG